MTPAKTSRRAGAVTRSSTPGARRPGRAPRRATEAHRLRILSAMSQLACERGIESVSVSRVVRLAGVSRATFYALFADRYDCFDAVLGEAAALVGEHVESAYRSHPMWIDAVRAGLFALLELLDNEPELAQLCIVQAMAAPQATLLRRGDLLAELAAVLNEGGAAAGMGPALPRMTAEGLLGGTLAVIHTHLVRGKQQKLVELLNPLMEMIAFPYLGHAAALRELSRAAPHRTPRRTARRADPDRLKALNMRLTYRTIRVVAAIAAEPGLSNVQVGQRAGITDQAQISRLLGRLAGLGLVENTGPGQPKGLSNSWQLTVTGRQVEWAFAREARAAGPWWRASS